MITNSLKILKNDKDSFECYFKLAQQQPTEVN